ncbi:hypothetical protein KC19_VG179500 [Ceratodon purpureus]|uniref:Uncharacterized protein n=1 Tax=Ceratodon purpureus TaxID=3225 RepID=A0A8T0HRQ3_CERPU|nr:hypothetical protein KC19_VG179500 [Ceratodon purpureus]
MEEQLSTRLQQADLLKLENLRLTLELASLTLPPREISHAVRHYAATKQRDLGIALAGHRADSIWQQRWLARFEDRDPTFEPWLSNDKATDAQSPNVPLTD